MQAITAIWAYQCPPIGRISSSSAHTGTGAAPEGQEDPEDRAVLAAQVDSVAALEAAGLVAPAADAPALRAPAAPSAAAGQAALAADAPAPVLEAAALGEAASAEAAPAAGLEAAVALAAVAPAVAAADADNLALHTRQGVCALPCFYLLKIDNKFLTDKISSHIIQVFLTLLRKH